MTTIGVALMVPEPWGSTIQAYRDGIGDPMGDHIPPHITVMPPVDIASSLMPTVEEHLRAAAASVAPIAIRLRGTDSFRPVSPVVFVDLAEGMDGCRAVERAVRTGPLGIDPNWPYHPHVTIAHDLEDSVLDAAEKHFADFEASFTVASLSMFVHEVDHGWNLALEFPLGG